MSIKTFIRAHPVLTYFVLTFVISTSGILVLVLREEVPISLLNSTIAAFALFAGPSVASLLLTGLFDGMDGFRALLSRLLKWRVSIQWYAVAILVTPLIATPIIFTLSLFSVEFIPAIATTDNRVSLLLTGLMVGFIGGTLEELGWTGFAVPRLRLHYGAFSTSLLVSVVWALWHIPITFFSTVTPTGTILLPLFLPPVVFYVAVLPAFRTLMVWVYDHTESLLVTMLMHISLAAFTFVILLPPAQGTSLIFYYLILAIVLWIIAAAVYRRQPLIQQRQGTQPVQG